MNAHQLIDELTELTRLNLNKAQELMQLSEAELNHRPTPESWSALECLEHLNLYGDYYLPEIAQRLKSSKHQASNTFKPGLLGNYFANSMKYKDKLNKMRTFADKNPKGSALDKSHVERFINQQHEMLALLKKCRAANLTRIKTGITISQWIKLRVGDTLRVVIYHNERHIIQATKALPTQARKLQSSPA